MREKKRKKILSETTHATGSGWLDESTDEALWLGALATVIHETTIVKE